MFYCYFSFGFYLIFHVLLNKSGKDKSLNILCKISGNLRYLGRLSTE